MVYHFVKKPLSIKNCNCQISIKLFKLWSSVVVSELTKDDGPLGW